MLIGSLGGEHLIFALFFIRHRDSSAAMVAPLRSHISHFALEHINRLGKGQLRLVIPFMGDQLPSLRLAAYLRFRGTMLMVFTTLDVDDDVNEVFLTFSQFENAGFGRFSSA